MATDTYTSSGSWVCPAGVTSVSVECWGGGGGGGTTVFGAGSGGGGGGAYAKKNSFAVTPGNSYTVTVGAAVAAGTNGNPSWFNATGTVYAIGGGLGTGAFGTPGAGGQGGQAISCVGDVKYNGGDGASGDSTDGGGGGGGAGSTGAGGTGSVATGGTGTSVGGGNGGGNNTAGSAAGGGGGGGTRTVSSGGGGARGEVRITYTVSSPSNSNFLAFFRKAWDWLRKLKQIGGLPVLALASAAK